MINGNQTFSLDSDDSMIKKKTYWIILLTKVYFYFIIGNYKSKRTDRTVNIPTILSVSDFGVKIDFKSQKKSYLVILVIIFYC